MAAYFTSPRYTALDINGKPISGAKLHVYTQGTTTPVTTYSDNALSSAHPSPVVADSNGIFPAIYLSPGSYKLRLLDANDVERWIQDDVAPFVPADNGVIAVANGGTGASNATTARTNLGAASAADVTALSTDIANVIGQFDNIGGTIGDVAALDAVGPTHLATGFDAVCLQDVRVNLTSELNVTSAFGFDNTSPQSSEGTSILSTSFTPTRSDSVLQISYYAPLKHITGSGNFALGLFTSNSLSAIQTSPFTFANVNYYYSIFGEAFYSPGSTSSLTISLRGGSGGTTRINGDFGSSTATFLRIRELVDTPIS